MLFWMRSKTYMSKINLQRGKLTVENRKSKEKKRTCSEVSVNSQGNPWSQRGRWLTQQRVDIPAYDKLLEKAWQDWSDWYRSVVARFGRTRYFSYWRDNGGFPLTGDSVGGSCAEHLTVESYTIIISLQSYLLSYLLLVFHHPLTLSL